MRRALAALFGGAVGKDTVSRVWRKTKGDWDAWNARSLIDEPIIRIILDGTVVRVRLDKKATSISLLVALGVRSDGQKVLLAIKNMGGESEAAWRALLDNLVARGLKTPELVIVDGSSGLDKALAALGSDVPVQRCTVHNKSWVCSTTTGFGGPNQSCSSEVGHISFGVKPTGERRAGNPHTAFDAAGAGNVAWPKIVCDTRKRTARQQGTQTPTVAGAPVLDPTTEEALVSWRAQSRKTPGGQPHYSNLAIETALTLRAVFRLALRQSEGLIGSIMELLEIDLPVPDHSTLSRRACGVPV